MPVVNADLTDVEEFTEPAQGPGTGCTLTSAVIRGWLQRLTNRTRWLFARLNEIVGTPFKVTSVDATANSLTLSAAHSIGINAPVRLFTVNGGVLPAPLSVGVVYFVKTVPDPMQLTLSATAGGSMIDLTTAGSGDIYALGVNDGLAGMFAGESSPSGVALPSGSIRGQITALAAAFGQLAAANSWTSTNYLKGSTWIQQDRATVAPAGAPLTLAVAVPVYSVDGTGGAATVSLSAPGAALPTNVVIRFVMTVIAGGAPITLRSAPNADDLISLDAVGAWADIQYAGSTLHWKVIGRGPDTTLL